jgi:prepilin-type processing-associated H-X9-DG protein
VSIVLRCECGNEFQTPDEDAGRPARCPVCQRELNIPRPTLPPHGELDEFCDVRPSRTSGKAIASFSLGLCCALAGCLAGQPAIIFLAWCFAGVPAIILGTLALRDINVAQKQVTGKDLASTGILLGTLATIVVVLLGLLSEGHEVPRRAQCANNLKQIALAMQVYHDQHGTYPPAASYDANGKPLLSWRVLLLPYLEQQSLYEQFHFDEPWDSPHNKPLAARTPPVFEFRCPSEPRLSQGLTTYKVIVDPRSMFTGDPAGVPFSSVSDGSSTTLLVVEAASPVPWTKPEDLSLSSLDQPLGVGSKHPGGLNAAMADGSVRFLRTLGNDAIGSRDLRALATRDGHEAVATP